MQNTPTQKGKLRMLSTPKEIASMFLPGSTRYIRVITVGGLFFFQVSIFPPFRVVGDDELVCAEEPGTEGHERLCEHLASIGKLKPARFILGPPIPLSFVADCQMTLYQVLADAQKKDCLARVFCELYEDELLTRARFELSVGEEREGARPCMIVLSVKGVCFETVFMLTEKNGMQYALYTGETPQDEDVTEFSPVFSLA